jgi:hypothetical protein
MDAGAAHVLLALDQEHALARLGGLDARLVAGGAAADHDDVVRVGVLARVHWSDSAAATMADFLAIRESSSSR